MKSYVILALVILGHLCQIHAATLSKPAKNTDDATKKLTEELSRSLMEHREDIMETLKALEKPVNSFGDETDEQAIPAVIWAIAQAIAGGAVSGAVGAGVAAAINNG
ncbi:uncharacterized protein LOC119466593 [Dermacentor silvarum]|uniref:uncharacterized protein LOC119466593 n=1 Tax=Dermacentor silvarum TaxID=543639 RepID=UPI001897D01F|nr:uncharacterized protein LOC119466593 [Dermacentor silvarum]